MLLNRLVGGGLVEAGSMALKRMTRLPNSKNSRPIAMAISTTATTFSTSRGMSSTNIKTHPSSIKPPLVIPIELISDTL
jgi:hypothetical protein